MAQVISCWPITAKARFNPWSVHVRLLVDKLTLGWIFLHAVLPCQYKSTNALYSFIHEYLILYEFFAINSNAK